MKRISKKLTACFFAFLAGAGFSQAQAATRSAGLSRNATSDCLPPVMSPWKFSTHTVQGQREFIATISVTCPQNVSYTVALLSAGDCRMQHDGMSIPYGVFSDPARVTPAMSCGGIPGEPLLSGSGSHVFVIYGVAQVSDGSLETGVYVDTVNAVLQYG